MPAKSVVKAVTEITPSPSAATSAAVKVTACVAPVAATTLVTLLTPLANLTVTVSPAEANRLNTPPVATASATEVAPPIPALRAGAGAAGGMVSSVKLNEPAWLALPAASVATADTLTAPSPSVATSVPLKVTACEAPVPATVFTTVCEPLV